VVHIEMPPLRLRGTDVITLAEHFLHKLSRENHKSVEAFSEEARAKLLAHRWPGNVRELENTIERAVVLCQGNTIEVDDLPLDNGSDGSRDSFGPVRVLGSTMAQIEKVAILKTLEACDGSTTRAAQMLGISVRTIQYRLHQYGMVRPAKSASSKRASSGNGKDTTASSSSAHQQH